MNNVEKDILDLLSDKALEIRTFQKEIYSITNEELIENYQKYQYAICSDMSFYRPLYIKMDIIKLEAKKRKVNLEEHQISLSEAMSAEDDF